MHIYMHTCMCTHKCTYPYTYAHIHDMVGLKPALGMEVGTPRGIHLWDRWLTSQNGEPRPDMKNSRSDKRPPAQRPTNAQALTLFSWMTRRGWEGGL